MDINTIKKYDAKFYMNTFGTRTPVCFTHGKGIELWDTEGRKYYDFLAGIAVNILGHSHEKLVSSICSQAKKLIHCSNLYYIENQAMLAKEIVENSCADKVFFANSGAEANEGAMKLARMHFYKKNQEHKNEIICLKKSFHGRTLATLAATGQEKYHKPFKSLIKGVKHVEINDISNLSNTITENTCAIMLEPIQGESGVNPVDKEFMQAVFEICKQNDCLVIFDEIQCGLGRTGKLFAYEHFGVEPHIFTLAKGLGGGVPLAAICAKAEIADSFEPGDHGTTFGGNPLACAAGLAVFDCLLHDSLVENAAQMGDYFFHCLQSLSIKAKLISEIRGKGLMIGIQFINDIAVDVKSKLFEKGYLVGSVGANVLRLLPPLIITKKDIDGFIEAFENVLESY